MNRTDDQIFGMRDRISLIGPPRRSLEKVLGQVNDLSRLRSRNQSLEVGIFATLCAFHPPFSGALNATPFLVQLFLFTDPFPLAFFHPVFLSGRLKLVKPRQDPQSWSGPAPH
jgi:hypothetical protein